MDYTRWAKDNKKRLVLKVIANAAPTAENEKPVAAFLAGIPGAGKTEFINRLEPSLSFARIDLDEIVKLFPNYDPKRYYEYRSGANIIVDEAVIYCRKKRINFILDGTFGSSKAIDNIKSALKRHDVVIFYVWKDPVQAWQLTKDRELITNRAIDKEGFIRAYENIPNNLTKVTKEFGDKAPIVAFKKNKTNDNFQMTQDSNIIDDLLENHYTKEELEQLIS